MSEWKTQTLESVVKFIDYRGKTPKKVDKGLRLITAKNVKKGYLQKEPEEFVEPEIYESWMTRGIPRKGDVLFTTEAPLGNVTQLDTDEKVVFAQRIIILQPNKKLIDPVFLKYLLLSKSMQKVIQDKGTGATAKGIKSKLLKKIEISFPPLEEQKRIVGILDEAFERIAIAEANTKNNLANAIELFNSYLNQVFTEKSDHLVSLSDLCIAITDGDHQPPPKVPEGIPFITISNINKQNRTIDFSDTFKVPSDYFNKLKEHRRPLQGDILYTVTGSYGIPVIVDDEKKFCFQRHIGLIRPNKETKSKYLYYLLLSEKVKKQADKCATGTAQKTVGLRSLRKFIVPSISLDDQIEIVDKLDNASQKIVRLEKIYQRKLEALAELKQSILQKAFTGQLT